MKVEDIMEEIEGVLQSGLLVPMKKNSVIINAGELRELLEELRAALPVELEEAENVLQQKEQIIASANAQAQQIVRNAEENRRSLISNSEIIHAAETKAKSILFNANTKVAELNRASMEYIENNLKQAEDALAKALQSVHVTKQAFAAKKQD